MNNYVLVFYAGIISPTTNISVLSSIEYSYEYSYNVTT